MTKWHLICDALLLVMAKELQAGVSDPSGVSENLTINHLRHPTVSDRLSSLIHRFFFFIFNFCNFIFHLCQQMDLIHPWQGMLEWMKEILGIPGRGYKARDFFFQQQLIDLDQCPHLLCGIILLIVHYSHGMEKNTGVLFLYKFKQCLFSIFFLQ